MPLILQATAVIAFIPSTVLAFVAVVDKGEGKLTLKKKNKHAHKPVNQSHDLFFNFFTQKISLLIFPQN